MKNSLNIVLVLIVILFVVSCGSPGNVTSLVNKNPMVDYEYDVEEGDYYHIIDNFFEENDIKAKNHHFKTFPVLYHIGEMEPEWEAIVREAITDYEDYFPMEEVVELGDADLVIKIVDLETVQRLYPELPDENLSGIGGIKQIYPKHESIVYLLPYAFQTPKISKAIVLHELGHAFGLGEHSDDPYDVMYPQAIANYNEETDLITVNGYELTLEEANYLSVRDLNTLWKLYNQW